MATPPSVASSPPETVLAELARRTDAEGPWASGAMRMLAERGLLARFVPADCGGTAAAEEVLVDTLATLASSCLTTALAVSQWAAAVRIIAAAPPSGPRTALLPALARGQTFTTVGISQLTTSRRHLDRPALVATRNGDGWRLEGLCPWVTGADSCDTIVTGAATEDGGQMFFVVPTNAAGLVIEPPLELLALTGSRTSAVRFTRVRPAYVIEPPEANAARTGGLATTALALGAARATIGVVADEARAREPLRPVAAGLAADLAASLERLRLAARMATGVAERDALRATANQLVLRAAQAAVTACKGAGFVRGHPTERLARESFFFLVWSCPQAVSDSLLCDLGGG